MIDGVSAAWRADRPLPSIDPLTRPGIIVDLDDPEHVSALERGIGGETVAQVEIRRGGRRIRGVISVYPLRSRSHGVSIGLTLIQRGRDVRRRLAAHPGSGFEIREGE